jgi:hypothetical protein
MFMAFKTSSTQDENADAVSVLGTGFTKITLDFSFTPQFPCHARQRKTDAHG